MFGLTNEQIEVIDRVMDNHEEEFKLWSEENESRLMKWYDENENKGLFETACGFAYYCTSKFVEEVLDKVED